MVDAGVIAQLKTLKEYAENHVFSHEEMLELQDMGEEAKDAVGKQFRVDIPLGYLLTFTIEDQGRDIGKCRHASMRGPNLGKAPRPEALDMVLPYLGFESPALACEVWLDHDELGQTFVHVIEVIDADARERVRKQGTH
jgi:hypothetical protein